MIEETEQISYQIADDNSGVEESSDPGTGILLDINNHKTNACVTPAEQSNNAISRMNSSSTSNNREDLGLETQQCPAALKLNVCRRTKKIMCL